MDDARARWGRRALLTAVVVIPLVYALVIDYDALDNPPAWDSAITVSPAALSIVDHDFDIWAVAQLPASPQGGPSTYSTSSYTILLAALIWLFGPATAFDSAHVLSLLLVAALTAGTYLLARQRTSARLSALAAITIGLVPLVVQQAADVYLDLPLAVAATFACWAATRRNFWLAAVFVIAGATIKTSGAFLVPLLLAATPPGISRGRKYAGLAIAGSLAAIPLIAALVTTHRFEHAGSALGNTILLGFSASTLVVTTDVFIILGAYLLVVYGRFRSGSADRVTKVGLIAVASFAAVHVATVATSGTIIILPRYYIAILPVMVVALLPTEESLAAKRAGAFAGVALVALLGLFSLVNIRGDFYPHPDHDFYVITERSTRAQTLLDLQMEGTRQLVATGLPLVVERQLYFQLNYPEMGYVAETPDSVIPAFLEPIDELPPEFAMLIERRVANPLVPIEERAKAEGYRLEYHDLTEGGFRSQVVVATR